MAGFSFLVSFLLAVQAYSVSAQTPTIVPNIDDPNAVNAQKVCPGYKASSVKNTATGFTATLTLAGPACNVYGTDVGSLDLTVEYQAQDRLGVNIVPSHYDASNESWYILPESLVPKPSASATASGKSDFAFTWSNDPSFNFQVIRKATGDILFNTAGSVLVFENQFLEFVTSVPENYNVYGLSEHMHALRLGNNFTSTSWNVDIGDPIDGNEYGTHPFYLETRYYEVNSNGGHDLVTNAETDFSKDYTSLSHGVFLRNAHGQEVLMGPSTITWRTIGGSIDLYFYSGPSQAEVTQNYVTSTVGVPAMQQYFTLGYHQCKWGYTGWADLQEVVANFSKAGIPLETIWSDIDYMDGVRDFNNDPDGWGYEEGAAFLSTIHQAGQHYVPIVDAAIYHPFLNESAGTYPTFDRGIAVDAFVKNPDGTMYIGQVWPGNTVFPDWLQPNTSGWWANEFSIWHGNINFDGIWLDMNEVSSFCTGSCGSASIGVPSRRSVNPKEEVLLGSREAASPGRDVNYPPYAINNDKPGASLGSSALSPNATHYGGVQDYDVHNLWGYGEEEATYQALVDIIPGKRPFIISRSTFAGSGRYTGHWGGDNYAEWQYLYLSIPQGLQFSLFGIPMFGVDTCGFADNTTEELCNRWMQLSAFFPFYRNHNSIGNIPQEPYHWASVTEASKTAMAIRYALLPYIYTLFYLAHTTGSTVMRAISWEFNNDPSLAAADRQYLLGPSLMIVPVLDQGATTVDGVFPGLKDGQVWYDWYTQTEVDYAKPGVNTTIDAPLGHIPVFVRGGSVLPMQQPALLTKDVRNSPWSLLVALGDSGSATGSVYIDDGESITPSSSLYVRFAAKSSNLATSGTGSFQDTNALANVTILGVTSEPKQVSFNNVNIEESAVNYNASSKVLVINGLSALTKQGAFTKDWTLKW